LSKADNTCVDCVNHYISDIHDRYRCTLPKCNDRQYITKDGECKDCEGELVPNPGLATRCEQNPCNPR